MELAAVADLNKPFFDDFKNYIISKGYESIFDFVSEEDDAAGYRTILDYMNRELPNGVILHDGIARPYNPSRAKWLFLGWLFRDAPEQRLRPMVSSMDGSTLNERRAALFNLIRKPLPTYFPSESYWQWEVVREIFIDRLEGSRRAIKGTLIESIVRRILADILSGYNVSVARTEVRLEGETFDISINGSSGTILMPVKTRETMGGGHALLFTRDIHKSITAAHSAGFVCIPIVIAESWSGDLQSLGCDRFIYLSINPNQIQLAEELLKVELSNCVEYILRQCLNQ